MSYHEVNFDGLIGPTHHYGGLAFGNLASTQHGAQTSNPRDAALQGLEKMWALHKMGLKQAILPPHERPDLSFLRSLGFGGSDSDVIEEVARRAPRLLSIAYSAAAMWTANAATMTPSNDSHDHRAHISPGNLVSLAHRAIEPRHTHRALEHIFANSRTFEVHAPLPAHPYFGDEGAANHTRLAKRHDAPGLHLFVYGRDDFDPSAPQPQRYPARHTKQASEAVARRHGIADDRRMFVQQNPAVIDQGVFHNDVISVGNENVLLYHADAFVDTNRVIEMLGKQVDGFVGIAVQPEQLSVAEAVKSYLFNSQLITLPDGSMALISPSDCRESDQARSTIEQIISDDNPISTVHYFDLRQSMRNGGGPACLRLRVLLTDQEIEALAGRVVLDQQLYEDLKEWIQRHYRDQLTLADLADPALVMEVHTALDRLSSILHFGSFYPFQFGGIAQ